MKVSIIIPAFNYAKFLPETLSSIIVQSYSDWECLVVDNASTDNTKEVMNNFVKEDKRIKYFYQPQPGPSAARNMGIKESTGDYIQFLDADDLLQPDKIKSGIETFQKNKEADIVYSGMRYFPGDNKNELFYSYHIDKSNNKEWMTYKSGRRKEILPGLLMENMMVISSPLIKKSSLVKVGLFDEELGFNEDWDLWLRFALNDSYFVYDNTPNTFVLVRVHKTSYSRDNFKMFLCGYRVCTEVLSKLYAEERNKTFEKKISFHVLMIRRMLWQDCSDRLLTLDRLNSMILIPGFEKYEGAIKFSQKSPTFLVKLVFYIEYRINSIKYKLM